MDAASSNGVTTSTSAPTALSKITAHLFTGVRLSTFSRDLKIVKGMRTNKNHWNGKPHYNICKFNVDKFDHPVLSLPFQTSSLARTAGKAWFVLTMRLKDMPKTFGVQEANKGFFPYRLSNRKFWDQGHCTPLERF